MDTQRTLPHPIIEMNESIWDYTNNLFNAEEDALALELSKSVLETFPENFKFINLCGCISYLMREFDDALEYFSRALKLSPDDEIIMSNIARVYFEEKKYADSLDWCNKVLSKEESDPQIIDTVDKLKNQITEIKNK